MVRIVIYITFQRAAPAYTEAMARTRNHSPSHAKTTATMHTAVEKTTQAGKKVAKSVPAQKSKEYWRILGPGLTTGASDDDPSGIATYSQAGAQYGFQLLWLAGFTFPLMAVVQEMCARIGLVTGRGLAGVIRIHFSKYVIYLCTLLLFAANTFNIGADLGAMAKAVQLLAPGINFIVLVIAFGALSLGLQVFTPYNRYSKYLKWLALVLLTYVASALMAHLNWGNVLAHAVVPTITFSKDQLLLICAILGTTISPYLFFWQTSQEVEEQIEQGKTSVAKREGARAPEIKRMRVDVWSGMLLSNVVMFFIIAACGGTLFTQGVTDIATAADAAKALKPVAGELSSLLFTIGIVGVGLLAIPVLAGSSSYAFAESMRLREGLYRPFRQARAFYTIIIMSMLAGISLDFIGLDPMKALIYSAVANGVIAPVVLTVIVLASSSKKIMGRWVNKTPLTILGWAITGIMAVSGVAAIISLFQ